MSGSVTRSAVYQPGDHVTPWQERVAGALLMAVVGPALALLPIRLGLRPTIAAAGVLIVGAGFLAAAVRARTEAARHQRRVVLRLRAPRASLAIAAAVLAGVAAVAALAVIYAHVVQEPGSPPPPWDEYVRRSPAHRVVGALAIVAVAPVMEELAFRGVLLTRLEARLGAARAIGGAAALFAVLHGEPWVMPVAFALGVVLGTLVWVSQSVWAAVLLHAGWNAFTYFDPLAPWGGQWTEGPRAVAMAAAILACSVAAVLAVAPRLRARPGAQRGCEQRGREQGGREQRAHPR